MKTAAKIGIIALLAIALFIPVVMIQSLVAERQQRRDEAVNGIAEGWGKRQIIAGPQLALPYERAWTEVTRELVDPERTVPLLRLAPKGTRPGVVDRNHGEQGLAPYRPIEQVELPHPAAYLLLDMERGEEFLNVRPEEALPVVLGRGRTPLTIEEGIAVVTHAPQVLEKNRCFMLSGSRRGDRRVPAMWISERAPKLGWCWDGNPHTWLGVASAGSRTA